MKHCIILMWACFAAGCAGHMADGDPSADDGQAYTSLFNGRDLTGWTGAVDGYGVKDGVLFCKRGGGGFLYTEQQFDNFILEFDFKLEDGSNNGLGIRYPGQGDAAYTGMELQILDNTADKFADLRPSQYHGSIYGLVAAERGHLKPVGQWNRQRVIANGPLITVILNGATIVDCDLTKVEKPHDGKSNRTGHIAWCGHGDYVEFRNIRIKPIADAAGWPVQ